MTNNFTLFNGSNPDNGSGMDRHWTGIGSAKSWRLALVLPLLFAFVFILGVGNAWGETVTFTAGTDTGSESVTKSGIKVEMSTMNRTDNYRCNASTSMKVSSTVGNITKIEITCTASGTSNYGPGKFSGTNYSYNGTKGTWSNSTGATSITLSASAQVRMTEIVVTYTPSAASHTLSSAVSPANSGTVTLGSSSVNEGSTTTATATPTAHYTFSGWSISGTGASLSSTTANPTTVTMGTANATVTATFTQAPKASVTLSEAGSTTTDATTYYVGDTYTLPSSTEATCNGKVLVGWSTVEVAETNTKPTTNYYEKGAEVTLGASQTFYAVFAVQSGSAPTANNGPSYSRSSSTDSYTSGYTFSPTNASTNNTDNKAESGSAGSTTTLNLYHTSTAIFSSTPARITVTAKLGGGNGNTNLTNPVYAQLVNSSGTGIGTPVAITSTITTGNGDTYTDVEMSTANITSAYGIKLYHVKQSGINVKFFSFSMKYYTGGYTYSKYSTTCCQQLAQINGSIFANHLLGTIWGFF